VTTKFIAHACRGGHGSVQEENSNQTELNQKLIQLFKTEQN
jgi:hypothetical protein